MSVITKEIEQHWAVISPLLSIRNEEEYDRAVERLNYLLDEVGTNEQHPLYELLDTLGTLIHAYEENHYSMPEYSGPELLQFLMEEHELTEAELPEVGSPKDISKILVGEQELNVEQIKALAERFHVSPSVFI